MSATQRGRRFFGVPHAVGRRPAGRRQCGGGRRPRGTRGHHRNVGRGGALGGRGEAEAPGTGRPSWRPRKSGNNKRATWTTLVEMGSGRHVAAELLTFWLQTRRGFRPLPAPASPSPPAVRRLVALPGRLRTSPRPPRGSRLRNAPGRPPTTLSTLPILSTSGPAPHPRRRRPFGKRASGWSDPSIGDSARGTRISFSYFCVFPSRGALVDGTKGAAQLLFDRRSRRRAGLGQAMTPDAPPAPSPNNTSSPQKPTASPGHLLHSQPRLTLFRTSAAPTVCPTPLISSRQSVTLLLSPPPRSPQAPPPLSTAARVRRASTYRQTLVCGSPAFPPSSSAPRQPPLPIPFGAPSPLGPLAKRIHQDDFGALVFTARLTHAVQRAVLLIQHSALVQCHPSPSPPKALWPQLYVLFPYSMQSPLAKPALRHAI